MSDDAEQVEGDRHCPECGREKAPPSEKCAACVSNHEYGPTLADFGGGLGGE